MQEGAGSSEAAAGILEPNSWISSIHLINHLTLFDKAVVAVVSDPMGGKTSFGHLLECSLDSQIKSVFLTMDPRQTKEDFFSQIAPQSGFDSQECTDFYSLVAQVNDKKAHILMLIDDAHHMPEEWVNEALWVFRNQAPFVFFHLCLISDYSITPLLNQLNATGENRLIQLLELGALSEHETRAYVQQYAPFALVSMPLTEAQQNEFYQLTKGNVAKINRSLESFLTQCRTRDKTNSSLAKKAGIATSIALIGGVLGFYLSQFWDWGSEPGERNSLIAYHRVIVPKAFP